LPETKEGYQSAVARILKERQNCEDKRVVVMFSRSGCPACVDASPIYSTLAKALPGIKFVWAKADVVDLDITPRYYIYDSVTGEYEELNVITFAAFAMATFQQKTGSNLDSRDDEDLKEQENS